MPRRKKVSQIKSLLLVVFMELEKLEQIEIPTRRKESRKPPPSVHLVLIKGGKDHD